jgi:hypothetical protein
MKDNVGKTIDNSFKRMYGMGKAHGLELAITAVKNYPPEEAMQKLVAMLAKVQVINESLQEEGNGNG